MRSRNARSRKISTHSEALAKKPNQTFNFRENIISQGFKTKIWGNLENSRDRSSILVLPGNFRIRELLSTSHLECA